MASAYLKRPRARRHHNGAISFTSVMKFVGLLRGMISSVALLGQMIVTRSLPPTPAPGRTVMLTGAGAVAHTAT